MTSSTQQVEINPEKAVNTPATPNDPIVRVKKEGESVVIIDTTDVPSIKTASVVSAKADVPPNDNTNTIIINDDKPKANVEKPKKAKLLFQEAPVTPAQKEEAPQKKAPLRPMRRATPAHKWPSSNFAKKSPVTIEEMLDQNPSFAKDFAKAGKPSSGKDGEGSEAPSSEDGLPANKFVIHEDPHKKDETNTFEPEPEEPPEEESQLEEGEEDEQQEEGAEDEQQEEEEVEDGEEEAEAAGPSKNKFTEKIDGGGVRMPWEDIGSTAPQTNNSNAPTPVEPAKKPAAPADPETERINEEIEKLEILKEIRRLTVQKKIAVPSSVPLTTKLPKQTLTQILAYQQSVVDDKIGASMLGLAFVSSVKAFEAVNERYDPFQKLLHISLKLSGPKPLINLSDIIKANMHIYEPAFMKLWRKYIKKKVNSNMGEFFELINATYDLVLFTHVTNSMTLNSQKVANDKDAAKAAANAMLSGENEEDIVHVQPQPAASPKKSPSPTKKPSEPLPTRDDIQQPKPEVSGHPIEMPKEEKEGEEEEDDDDLGDLEEDDGEDEEEEHNTETIRFEQPDLAENKIVIPGDGTGAGEIPLTTETTEETASERGSEDNLGIKISLPTKKRGGRR